MRYESLVRLIQRLRLFRKEAGHFEADISGSCEAPVTRELFAAPDRDRALAYDVFWIDPDTGREHAHYRGYREQSYRTRPSLTVILTVKCRKCPACLRLRAREWTQRCTAEIAQASRTWHTTVTFKPEVRLTSLYSAALHCRRRHADYDALPEQERHTLLCSKLGEHVTKALKRLRKQTGLRLRYCLVWERHPSSGFPHAHMLLHETIGEITKREIERAFAPVGFSAPRLVDRAGRSARYITKYIAKESGARVRASFRYGKVDLSTNTIFDASSRRLGEQASVDPDGEAEQSRAFTASD